MNITEVTAQSEKGLILRETENVSTVGWSVGLSKNKETGKFENEVWYELHKPKNFLGVFESQEKYFEDLAALTENQTKACQICQKSFFDGKSFGRLQSILVSYVDDLKLAVSAAIRSTYMEGPEDTVKPFADSFLAMLSVSPKLAAMSFEKQYTFVNSQRLALEDEPLPAVEVLKAKIDEIKAKKAARRKVAA